MVTKETIGEAVLYLADARDVLPGLQQVDQIITDPPYGIDPKGLGYGRGGRSIAGDQDLSVCLPVLKQSLELNAESLIAFHSHKNALQFLTAMTETIPLQESLVWDKRAPGMGGAIRYQHECIAAFAKEKIQARESCFSVLSFYRDAELHPHMKPIGLMEKLVRVFSGYRQLILDPFMGSGSTGVAALHMGRRFIGIEKDPAYFEVACKRIEEAQRQGDLFPSYLLKPAEQVSFDLD